MEKQIENAIQDSVRKNGQPAQLAEKIIAWMRALTSGNEQVHDSQAAAQHVGVLYDSVNIDGAGR